MEEFFIKMLKRKPSKSASHLGKKTRHLEKLDFQVSLYLKFEGTRFWLEPKTFLGGNKK